MSLCFWDLLNNKESQSLQLWLQTYFGDVGGEVGMQDLVELQQCIVGQVL